MRGARETPEKLGFGVVHSMHSFRTRDGKFPWGTAVPSRRPNCEIARCAACGMRAAPTV
jgi:hypothetical protein